MTSKRSPELRNRRARVRAIAASGAALALVVSAPRARAQSDVAPPLPNVLILLDSSGSMERQPNAALPMASGTTGTVSTAQSRWTQALQVLGGSIKNYAMLNVARDTSTGSDFFSEYNLGGIAPYDAGYALPHFRPLSGGCTIGASALGTTKTWPTDWTKWGVSDFGFRKCTQGSVTSGTCTLGAVGSCLPTDFATDGLGILDTFRDQARFGFMTFDSLPDPKTGWDGTNHLPGPGMTGQWSYYPNWNGTGSMPSVGWPTGCTIDSSKVTTDHVFELGARNPSAPPWEGPLVQFAADDSTTSLRTVNDRIRYAMLAARPFGATPIAPLLADAQYYLTKDPTGPKADPLNSCRGNFIILITDGFPNSDLRTACENPADPTSPATQVWPNCTDYTKGCCPAKRPQDIIHDLANPPAGTPAVKTFVVGFALSDDTGAPIDCSTVDTSPGGTCATIATTDPKYPCCTLEQMAVNGGTGSKALLANDTDSLRAALIAAMSAATASTSTSRTLPVFTQAAGSASSNGQYEFRSSFKVNAFSAWQGVLERIRWQCQPSGGTMQPIQQTLDPSQGDDFRADLNAQATRNFITVDATAGSTTNSSLDSLRPNLATADYDGIAAETGTVVSASNATFVSNVSSAALQLTPTSCSDTTDPNLCKQKYLNYALALPQPNTAWISRVGSALGDIYHATPVNIGPPGEFLRDESYTDYRNALSTRTPLLLTATNDGLLHAFKSSVTSTADPVELWAFIPPAVLPSIGKQYGGAHALLLDAAPLVKDVAFGPTGSSTPWGRTATNAKGGVANWRTVAVGGLTTGRGYYALDITDAANPKFLWQLTSIKDASGKTHEMFGQTPGVPAIGTVFYSDGGGPLIETPVAFLPGGDATLNASGTCARWNTPPSSTDTFTQWRNKVRCWVGAGLSFTVVRLYDGKIIRRFSNNPAGSGSVDHPAEPNGAAAVFVTNGKTNLVTDAAGKYAGIDSPLTGAVALYPAAVGSVTTRAFVGDYDGTLWKLDVSDPNPQNWTFGIFHDAYFPGDTANAATSAWAPVAIAPVLSVDSFGDIVVDYATGDQSNFSTSYLNHMYSVTERTTVVSGAKTWVPHVNWELRFSGGVTPTGPLSLFSGSLFFSTFTPNVSTSDACLSGQGTLWGVDYLDTEPSVVNTDGAPVPAGRHKITSSADTALASGTCPPSYANADARGALSYPYFRCIQLDPGTIVFGAGITQRPSCVITPPTALGTDPYVGSASTHSTITGINQGDFQLVAQTGPKSTSSTGSAGSTTNTYVRTLVPPLSVTRIDSWAAIVE